MELISSNPTMLLSNAFRVDIELRNIEKSKTTLFENIYYSTNSKSPIIQVNLLIPKFLSLFNYSLEDYQFTFLSPLLKTYLPYDEDHDCYTLNINQLPRSSNNRPLINLTMINRTMTSTSPSNPSPTKKASSERTIAEVLQFVRTKEELEAQGTKKIMEKLAEATQVNIGLLHNYLRYVKLAKLSNFDFYAHLAEKFRVVRDFVAKIKKEEESTPKKERKLHPHTKAFRKKKASLVKLKETTFLNFEKFKRDRTVGDIVKIVAQVNELLAGKVESETGLVFKVNSIHEAAKFMNISKNILYTMSGLVKDGIAGGFDFEKYQDQPRIFLSRYLLNLKKNKSRND